MTTKQCVSCAAISMALISAFPAIAQPDGETADANKPVVFTARQDHQNMLEQLGFTRLRPGRSSNADSPNAANYDEAKANPYPELPELLKTTTGEKVDTSETWWKKRRPEIVELLENKVYGRIPNHAPDVQWEVRQTREIKAGGRPAIQRQLMDVVDNSACPEIEVHLSMSLTLPKDAKAPVPVLLSFGRTPFEMEGFNFGRSGRRGDDPRPPSKRDRLIAAGWGCATLNPTSVQDDAGGWQPRRFGPGADPNAEPTEAGLTRGIIGLTNGGQPRKPDQWGALRAWAWGASRSLDYLETVPEVDPKRVGIAGVSRYGKAALVGMAFDQRFAMGLIASSGAGATTLYRRNFGESPENLDVSPSPRHDHRSLKQAVGDRFKIGVGVSHRVLQNPEDTALIRQHFQILTPENCMKPQNVHPAEDEWNFEAADRFAHFARDHQLELVGHCLVWAKDDRTDEWMTSENNKPVSRETLLHRIETHIHTVVQRYADIATQWDVVNEAIGDSGDELLRDSVYSRTTGIDFIVTAFKAARASDPDALLIYNDYNGHKPEKRKKLIELLTQLKQKGAPVDAYGMQGHFELGDDSIPQLRLTFDELRKLDIKVVVSELDIDVVKRGRWWAEDGKYREELATYNPYEDGLPEEIQQQQIEQYVALFKLFDEYKDIIVRVSFWNLHDGQSWLNYFPWRRTNYPLLFDRNRKPKPVFDAVYEYLQASKSAHVPTERRDLNSRMAHEQLLE